MKRYLYLLFIIIIFLNACGKSGSPSPDKTNGIGSTGATGGTGATGVTGNTGNTGTNTTAPKIETMSIEGGQIGFLSDSSLNTIYASTNGTGKVFQTEGGGTDQTSLVHAEGATLAPYNGLWRITFSNYSSTDTDKQAYIRVIHKDSNGNITDYRAMLASANSTLDLFIVTPSLTLPDAIKRVASNNQKIDHFDQ